MREVPPPPPPSESLEWRGSFKNAPQDLERLGPRGQNLDIKELSGSFVIPACTASAFTMICSLKSEVKVTCHKRAVEKLQRGVRPVGNSRLMA